MDVAKLSRILSSVAYFLLMKLNPGIRILFAVGGPLVALDLGKRLEDPKRLRLFLYYLPYIWYLGFMGFFVSLRMVLSAYAMEMDGDVRISSILTIASVAYMVRILLA